MCELTQALAELCIEVGKLSATVEMAVAHKSFPLIHAVRSEDQIIQEHQRIQEEYRKQIQNASSPIAPEGYEEVSCMYQEMREGDVFKKRAAPNWVTVSRKQSKQEPVVKPKETLNVTIPASGQMGGYHDWLIAGRHRHCRKCGHYGRINEPTPPCPGKQSKPVNSSEEEGIAVGEKPQVADDARAVTSLIAKIEKYANLEREKFFAQQIKEETLEGKNFCCGYTSAMSTLLWFLRKLDPQNIKSSEVETSPKNENQERKGIVISAATIEEKARGAFKYVYAIESNVELKHESLVEIIPSEEEKSC